MTRLMRLLAFGLAIITGVCIGFSVHKLSHADHSPQARHLFSYATHPDTWLVWQWLVTPDESGNYTLTWLPYTGTNISLTRAAFSSWENVLPGTNFQEIFVGTPKVAVRSQADLTGPCRRNYPPCFVRTRFFDDRRGGIEGEGINVIYNNGGTIWIRSNVATNKWQGTIAHEIGHLFGLGDQYIHTGTDPGQSSCNNNINTIMDAAGCDGSSPTSLDISDVQSYYYPSEPDYVSSYLCYPNACFRWLDVEESNTWEYLDFYRVGCGGGEQYLGADWVAEGTGDYNVNRTYYYPVSTNGYYYASIYHYNYAYGFSPPMTTNLVNWGC